MPCRCRRRGRLCGIAMFQSHEQWTANWASKCRRATRSHCHSHSAKMQCIVLRELAAALATKGGIASSPLGFGGVSLPRRRGTSTRCTLRAQSSQNLAQTAGTVSGIPQLVAAKWARWGKLFLAKHRARAVKVTAPCHLSTSPMLSSHRRSPQAQPLLP